jgi:hypothetical protein
MRASPSANEKNHEKRRNVVDEMHSESQNTPVPPEDCSVMGDAELPMAGLFYAQVLASHPHRSNTTLAKLTLSCPLGWTYCS